MNPFNGKGNMHRELAGQTLMVEAVVGYPGSGTSDIWIGNAKYVIANDDLRKAGARVKEEPDV